MLNVYIAKNGFVLQHVERVDEPEGEPLRITREAALTVRSASARGLPVALAGAHAPAVGMDQFLDIEVPDDLGEEELVQVKTKKFKVVTKFFRAPETLLDVINRVATSERVKRAEDMLDAPGVLANASLIHCSESYAVRAIDDGILVRRTFDRVQEKKKEASDEAPALWSEVDPLEQHRRDSLKLLQDHLAGPFSRRPTEVYGFKTPRELTEFLWLQLVGEN